MPSRVMLSNVAPPPDRFAVRRTGTPDRLSPAIAVPARPESEPAPDGTVPREEPVPQPAAPVPVG